MDGSERIELCILGADLQVARHHDNVEAVKHREPELEVAVVGLGHHPDELLLVQSDIQGRHCILFERT